MESLYHNSFRSDAFVQRCAWLVNPGESPRRDVRCTVEQGKIVEICDVPADERSMIDAVAIMPRFVNAHTHLEFSQLSSPLPPPEPFTKWIQSVICYRGKSASECEFPGSAIERGWAEATGTGSCLVGEITTSDAGQTALRNQVLKTAQEAISFREVLGFTADRIESQLDVAKTHIAGSAVAENCSVTNGLSPHAPYSVHPDLFAATVDLAVSNGCPIAMHLAETQAEVQLLAEQSGPFVDLLSGLNLWNPQTLSPGTSAMKYLQQLAKVPHALAVHGNYLSTAEISFLANHPHVSVVYCPRTHAWFGHAKHPWQQLRDAGATVILGTDSRASNPDLSIWKELQFVAKLSPLPIWSLLPMITTTAAAALGVSASDYVLHVGGGFSAVAATCQCDSVERLDEILRLSQTNPTPFSVGDHR